MRKILYFIGAGLTKSLELPGKSVPLMYDYISVMADYLDDDIILTQLADLELGEPHPYKWKDIQTIELAKILTGENADRSVENRDVFRRLLKNKPWESIEDLLEKAGTIASIRFIYAVDRLFYLINWSVNSGPLESFLKEQFRLENTNHTFVSFNYDLVLDRSVQKQIAGGWDVATDYGFAISWQITTNPPPMPGNGGVLPTLDAAQLQGLNQARSRVLILKPHGSLNWLVPLRMPYSYSPHGIAFEDGPLVVPLSTTRELRYWYKSDDFQYLSFPNTEPKDVMPCIIPPTKAKDSTLPFIQETRSRLSQAIRDADEVYVLGWSMPKTDEDQERAIRSAIDERPQPVERMTVVNRGASPDYFERVACVFGVKRSQLKVFNGGFCEFVAQSVVDWSAEGRV